MISMWSFMLRVYLWTSGYEEEKLVLESEVLDFFGLVSLFFNGISTLFKLFNAKAILLEKQ